MPPSSTPQPLPASGAPADASAASRGFVVEIRVVFGDCDPAGIVYFPNFYRWFDQATHDLCAAAGYDLGEVRAQRGWVGYPIAEASAKFRAPATFGDLITVETRVQTWQPRFFLLSHRVRRGGQLLAEGAQTRFIGYHDASRGGKLAALEIPAAFREAIDAVAY
ncbi:MAG: acyl-CoA thioesterase [Lautropia sp.]